MYIGTEKIIMLITLTLLKSPKTVKVIAFDTTNDEHMVIMTTYSFQCYTISMTQCKATGSLNTMTSSNENIFRVTGPLCGEFTGDRWIPLTKASDAELSLICASINGWVNNREAGDVRRYRAHYDGIVVRYHWALDML